MGLSTVRWYCYCAYYGGNGCANQYVQILVRPAGTKTQAGTLGKLFNKSI